MYGISNSQQQGGGGGGSAASYKAIKSTLTASDWQEVAKQPYFVGSNAMEWPEDSDFGGAHGKRSETVIGLITGEDYTISATIDGQVYTKTAQAFNPSSAMKGLMFYFAGVGDDGSITNEDELIALQIIDDASAMVPGFNSFVLIKAPATVTSYTITSFSGPGLDFGSSGKATISDSAIKVNSAVTMYTNTSEKIAVGEKTNGSVTLTADSIPTVSIPYNLEIVGTDTEGLFELVNGYVPDISSSSSAPVDKSISHTSTNVSITGSASPYLFTVMDSDIRSYKFVRLYPNDENTETWLNEHTLSSIITEERGKFTFKVDTNTLPNTFSITYVIENFM